MQSYFRVNFRDSCAGAHACIWSLITGAHSLVARLGILISMRRVVRKLHASVVRKLRRLISERWRAGQRSTGSLCGTLARSRAVYPSYAGEKFVSQKVELRNSGMILDVTCGNRWLNSPIAANQSYKGMCSYIGARNGGAIFCRRNTMAFRAFSHHPIAALLLNTRKFLNREVIVAAKRRLVGIFVVDPYCVASDFWSWITREPRCRLANSPIVDNQSPTSCRPCDAS